MSIRSKTWIGHCSSAKIVWATVPWVTNRPACKQGVAIYIFILLFFLVPYSRAQNVGPGEQRFNERIYKGSHNSEVRDESLADQIDKYNVWQLELDIMDYNGQLKVPGDSCDPASLSLADSLPTLLTKLQAESDPVAHPFTLIYLDMKGMGQDGCAYTWGSEIKDRLKAAFTSSLGESTIYPSHEFATADSSSWPSYQNLAGRHFRWAVIVDWHGMTPVGVDHDDLLFEATSINPTDTAVDSSLSPSTVLVNIEGGCDVDPTSTQPGIRNARWLYRIWPSGNCSLDCELMDGAYWDNAVAKQYNFIATNCINYANTFSPPTHSPDPLYVNQARTSCVNGYHVCEWGTSAFPYHDLGAALNRASTMVSVLLGNGDYVITAENSPRIIDKPLRLKAEPGSSAVLR